MHTTECQLQQNSKSKTVCMHFCQLRKAHDDPVLTLDGTPIPVVEETNFLGVIFYTKKTYVYTPY